MPDLSTVLVVSTLVGIALAAHKARLWVEARQRLVARADVNRRKRTRL